MANLETIDRAVFSWSLHEHAGGVQSVGLGGRPSVDQSRASIGELPNCFDSICSSVAGADRFDTRTVSGPIDFCIDFEDFCQKVFGNDCFWGPSSTNFAVL